MVWSVNPDPNQTHVVVRCLLVKAKNIKAGDVVAFEGKLRTVSAPEPDGRGVSIVVSGPDGSGPGWFPADRKLKVVMRPSGWNQGGTS